MRSAQKQEEVEVESSLTESPSRLTESRVTDAAVTNLHYLLQNVEPVLHGTKLFGPTPTRR